MGRTHVILSLLILNPNSKNHVLSEARELGAGPRPILSPAHHPRAIGSDYLDPSRARLPQ